jgi:TPP-dependent pyruvate/acetoin dehydrogenase alpha subunit
LKNGLLTEQQIKDIEKSVIDEVEEAVQFADESPKPVSSPFLALGYSFWGIGI